MSKVTQQDSGGMRAEATKVSKMLRTYCVLGTDSSGHWDIAANKTDMGLANVEKCCPIELSAVMKCSASCYPVQQPPATGKVASVIREQNFCCMLFAIFLGLLYLHEGLSFLSLCNVLPHPWEFSLL